MKQLCHLDICLSSGVLELHTVLQVGKVISIYKYSGDDIQLTVKWYYLPEDTSKKRQVRLELSSLPTGAASA